MLVVHLVRTENTAEAGQFLEQVAIAALGDIGASVVLNRLPTDKMFRQKYRRVDCDAILLLKSPKARAAEFIADVASAVSVFRKPVLAGLHIVCDAELHEALNAGAAEVVLFPLTQDSLISKFSIVFPQVPHVV